MIEAITLILLAAAYLLVAVPTWMGTFLLNDPYGHAGLSPTARVVWSTVYAATWPIWLARIAFIWWRAASNPQD